MKIVIVGAGEIGFFLARKLSQEKHDLTIIDEDGEKCRRAEEVLDLAAVEGNGADPETLRVAGIEKADMLIAASANDEVNILSCMLASRLGVKFRIARVRNRSYYSKSPVISAKDLGVDLFIHPEEEVAGEINRLLIRSTVSEIVEFENGKILFVGLKLDERCPHLNRQLKEFGSETMRGKFRVVAMWKNNRTIIPTGEDVIQKNDQLFVVTRADDLPELLTFAGKADEKLEKIMVLGAGKIGRAVARDLEGRGIDVTVVESDREKSRKMAGELKKGMVIQADGTEIDVLAREGILDMDAFVSVTSDDETNIIACLLARHLKIRKTIALVNRVEYLPLMPVIGIDSTVNVRLATANAILRFIRRGKVLSLAAFHGIDAEAIEFEIHKKGKLTGRPLRSLRFPEGAVVAIIIRGGKAFVPHGESTIEEGDRVIFFALPHVIPYLEAHVS